MRLLDPSYDSVFKYLLEDLDIAQGLISRIIGKEIVELTPLPQEQTSIELEIKYIALPLHRQDYVVAIKSVDEQGNSKIEKIMIEMQKSSILPEISRFRQYIADKYHHRSQINGKEYDLPITTIYIVEKTFNSKLPPILYVKNQYIDRLTGKPYEGEPDEFVDLLNHESYFIQSALLPDDYRNELLRILSIFSPNYKIRLGKKERYIDLPEELIDRFKDKILHKIIRRLQLAENDNKLTTALDLEISYEDEWERTLIALEQERKAKEELMKKLATKMKKYGETIEDIIKETGLSREEIEKL